MYKFLTIGLSVAALLTASLPALAEGDGPRARSKQLRKEGAAKAGGVRLHAVPALEAPQDETQEAKWLPVGCPADSAGWIKWRDEVVKLLLEPKALDGEDAEDAEEKKQKHLSHPRVMSRSTQVGERLKFCKGAGSEPPAGILDNLKKFIDANRKSNYQSDLKHQFGHQMKDTDYLARVRTQLELPCLLSHWQFLEYISSPTKYHRAMRMIEEQNNGVKSVEKCDPDGTKWRTLIYRSKFLPTPDYAETFGRFFVLVEGAKHDQWIQFGIWLPEDERKRKDYGDTIHNVSVVSVAKGANPRADNRIDALADWWRVAKDGEFELELKFRRETPPYETDNCLRCHKTVPVGIHPAKTYTFVGDKLKPFSSARAPANRASGTVPEDPTETLAYLRKYIRDEYDRPPIYETDASDTVAKPGNYGPAFGPDKTRPPQSLEYCIKPGQLKPASVANVISKMNCVKCHNGGEPTAGPKLLNIGLLNYPLATEMRTSLEGGGQPNLIRSHILSGAMPPKNSLTDPERRALYRCLSLEYFDPDKKTGLLYDWLRK